MKSKVWILACIVPAIGCTAGDIDESGIDRLDDIDVEADKERGPLGKADRNGGTCVDSGCDGAGRGGRCWCDSQCSGYGDCCSDYEPVCKPRTPTNRFEKSTCVGEQLTDAAIVRWFEPGETEIRLGRYQLHLRYRDCNSVTACSPWHEDTMIDPTASTGGNTRLKIWDGEIQLWLDPDVLSGSHSSACSDPGGELDCAHLRGITHEWSIHGTVGGSPKWVKTRPSSGNRFDFKPQGLLAGSCGWLIGSSSPRKGRYNTWKEAQMVIEFSHQP